MNQLTGLFLLMSLLGWGSVQAHAHLVSSVPTEGSVLGTPPASLVLTFSEPTRITAAALQKDNEAKQAACGEQAHKANAHGILRRRLGQVCRS